MVTIEKRLKQFAYKKNEGFYRRELIPKSEDIVFLICDELKREDFPEPFFNSKGVISLGNGFKFLTYCGKNQRDNINKNALVIEKKLSKNNQFIYRVYLMGKDNFNIRELFKTSYTNNKYPCEENGFNLSPSYYMGGGLKEEYSKKEVIFIINKCIDKLVNWSLKQK